MTSVPGARRRRPRPAPNRTASTSGVSETQTTTMPGSGDGVGRRCPRATTPEVGELRRATRRPVPARDREPGPGQVGGHRRAHRAEPEERDATASRDGFGGHGRRQAGVSGGSAGAPGRRLVGRRWRCRRRRRSRLHPRWSPCPSSHRSAAAPRIDRPRAMKKAAIAPTIAIRMMIASRPPLRFVPGSGGATGLGAGVGGGARARRLGRDDDRRHDDLDRRLRVAVGDDRDAGHIPPRRCRRRRPRPSRRSPGSAGCP